MSEIIYNIYILSLHMCKFYPACLLRQRDLMIRSRSILMFSVETEKLTELSIGTARVLWMVSHLANPAVRERDGKTKTPC